MNLWRRYSRGIWKITIPRNDEEWGKNCSDSGYRGREIWSLQGAGGPVTETVQILMKSSADIWRRWCGMSGSRIFWYRTLTWVVLPKCLPGKVKCDSVPTVTHVHLRWIASSIYKKNRKTIKNPIYRATALPPRQITTIPYSQPDLDKLIQYQIPISNAPI